MTDTSVQFFSHSNGLTLSNNWGDLIRLLDTCLVTGKALPTILLQSIDKETGDITLEFSANHNCMLLQIIELSGFAPVAVNGKYRIKNIPNTKTLILKSTLKDVLISSIGIVKLAPLGYEIIFRDDADVKRVYRAINPTSKHPFIRVDESMTSPDGTGVYAANCAKTAMVGLLENMTHIDDYENPDVLQLPFNNTDPKLNWTISGTGNSCKRGWSKWIWAGAGWWGFRESATPVNGNRSFQIIGDSDAFYFVINFITDATMPVTYGCGIYEDALDTPYPWFIASFINSSLINTEIYGTAYFSPFTSDLELGYFLTTNRDLIRGSSLTARVMNMTPSAYSGSTNFYNNLVPAFSMVILDSSNMVRGSLKHIKYAGKRHSASEGSVPIIDENQMYNWSTNFRWYDTGGHYYYLGEL